MKPLKLYFWFQRFRAAIDDDGNPRHPTFTVLHCLWKLQRCVLPVLRGWLRGWLPALSWFWFSVRLCLAWAGRPVIHQDLVHSSQYLMPCEDIGWRLTIQIDHGFSRTRRPACDALMETNQDCFAASAMRHVRADDTHQEREDSDSAGSEHTADED